MNAEGALARPSYQRLLSIDSSDRVRDGDRGSHNRTAAPRLEAHVDRIRALGPHLYGRREGRGLVGDGTVGHFATAFVWRTVPVVVPWSFASVCTTCTPLVSPSPGFLLRRAVSVEELLFMERCPWSTASACTLAHVS